MWYEGERHVKVASALQCHTRNVVELAWVYVFLATHSKHHVCVVCMSSEDRLHIPSLPHSSPSMESGLAEGALVSPHMIMTSVDMRRSRSMGQGWVVKVEEEET